MKLPILTLGLAAVGLALPALEQRDSPQTVRLTFHGGPASYSMEFPADGVVRETNNDLAVSVIDAPDYFAQSHCTFKTESAVSFQGTVSPTGTQQLLVGPPQPIHGVSCEGVCLPTYANCFEGGQFLGQCCAGFCAANKCRPWVNPTA